MPEESSSSALGFREVVAVFGSERAFSDAMDDLQTHGVDRARISVLATGTPEAGRRLTEAGFRTVADVLDAHGVPRTVYEQPEDVGAAKGLVISGLVYVGGMLGAGLTVATGGAALAPIIAAAAASAAAGGGVGAFLTRRLGTRRSAYIEESLAHGGLVLWVAAKDATDEQQIETLLKNRGGTSVHGHALD